MRTTSFILITTFALAIACGDKPDKKEATKDYSKFKNEINNLKSLDEKKRYLEGVLEDDQRVRDADKSHELMLKYGRGSKEYYDYGKNMREQDAVNLIKIEHYLAVHGYPTEEMGEKATTAPWMVIHHAQDYEARERNFETLHKAYLNGSLEADALSFYLGRMYEMKFGERHRMENPYRLEDEINQLMNKLGPEGKK